MSARLASGLWVSAYLTRLRLAEIAAYVTQKGDATAGAVVVKVATLDGQARAFQRSFVLADGVEVGGADLDHGLLHIDLRRQAPETVVQTIRIGRT